MIRFVCRLALAALFFLPVSPVLAGDGASSAPAVASDTGSSGGDVPRERGADWDARLALAKRMHEIQPAAGQLDDAIASVAERLPVQERKGFEIAMKKILDYKTLEQTSIEAMAETFTLSELKAMVAYNESPEAQSISKKFSIYQGKIQPKVYEMLDRAMMQVRTGSIPGTQK